MLVQGWLWQHLAGSWRKAFLKVCGHKKQRSFLLVLLRPEAHCRLAPGRHRIYGTVAGMMVPQMANMPRRLPGTSKPTTKTCCATHHAQSLWLVYRVLEMAHRACPWPRAAPSQCWQSADSQSRDLGDLEPGRGLRSPNTDNGVLGTWVAREIPLLPCWWGPCNLCTWHLKETWHICCIGIAGQGSYSVGPQSSRGSDPMRHNFNICQGPLKQIATDAISMEASILLGGCGSRHNASSCLPPDGLLPPGTSLFPMILKFERAHCMLGVRGLSPQYCTFCTGICSLWQSWKGWWLESFLASSLGWEERAQY